MFLQKVQEKLRTNSNKEELTEEKKCLHWEKYLK